MPHHAQAVLLHCMDFRFIHEIVHFMKAAGLIDQYDDVSVAGAAKSIASPDQPTDREMILHQIELSQKLHGTTDVYLMNHLDCGAYGGHAAFANDVEEHANHVDELDAAAVIVAERFPGLTVHRILARIDTTGKIDFEKLA